jgi:hypothetical protein
MAAAQPQPGIEVNVGRCVDWQGYRNIGHQQVLVQGQGWRITGIMEHALAIGDSRYIVSSNFGNGPDTDILFPHEVTNMYDCPAGNAAGPAGAGAGANGAAGNNAMNVNMLGGRKKRKVGRNRKSRKARKARKAHKRTRKH